MSSVIHPSLNSDIDEVADVGALLRAARLRRGDNLRQVANVLRIRYDYLESIENGRLNDLPGAIYSSGFIRAYSEYLGLDGEELVSKLKSESNVLTDSTKLVFPAIIPEDGIPGSLVILIGLLITVMGYCTWYWFSSPDVFVADNLTTLPKVAPIKVEPASTKPPAAGANSLVEASSAIAATAKFPSQNYQNVEKRTEVNSNAQTSLKPTQEVLGNTTVPETPKILSHEAISNEPSRLIEGIALVEPNKVISPTDNRTTDLDVPQEYPLAVQQIPEDRSVIGSVDDASPPASLEKMEVQKTVARNAVIDETLPQSQPTKPDPVQAAFDDSAPDTLSKLPDRTDTEIATLSVLDEKPREVNKIITPILNEDQKFDVKNISRITITARNTSWIQLRDIRTNRMILSKVLKKDQSYQIPDRSGLSLMTGNAGALEITVDGEVVPDVGKLGEIRRKVLMEVKSLRSGQAVVE